MSRLPVEYVLRYIYTGRFIRYTAMIDELYGDEWHYDTVFAAEKYDLEELKLYHATVLLAHKFKEEDRLKQLEFADRFRLQQLKAVCVATLSTNLAILESDPPLPRDLQLELIREAAKRQFVTKEINVKTEANDE